MSMDDKSTEFDLEMNYVTLEPMSFIDTNPFENVPEELWPIVYKEFFNHSSQSTEINCTLSMADNCFETEESNANGLLPFLQGQSSFQEIQPNLVFEYNELSRVNMEMHGSQQEDSVDISVVRKCIPTAKYCLLGINSQHNDPHAENFDSRSEGLIPSEILFFNLKPEVPVLQSDHLDTNVDKNRDDKSEGIELTKEVLKFDPINFDLNFRNGSGQQNDYQEEQHSEQNRKITDEKSVQCDVCEKRVSKKHIARHMHLHTETKPFQCNVCGKGFTVSSILTNHMRTHTGEKPFHCNVCKKCFSQSINLTIHKRTHTGEKPFQCDVCEKQFSTSTHLNTHMRTHTGEKPYQCPSCKKKFSQRAAHKPNITPQNAKHRLQWLRAHLYWTVDMWKTILWSNESPFTVWQSDVRVWIWRMHGERFFSDSIVPTVKFSGGRIMVWGCFS
ncbi:zinc finger protein 713 [Trichonephila clavipes]|nr:zinc finger protein 713 [Trichonephila clavipes]